MITGEQIKAARERIGESQEAFSRRLRIDQATLSRWETKGVPDRGPASIAVEAVLAELPSTSEAAE